VSDVARKGSRTTREGNRGWVAGPKAQRERIRTTMCRAVNRFEHARGARREIDTMQALEPHHVVHKSSPACVRPRFSTARSSRRRLPRTWANDHYSVSWKWSAARAGAMGGVGLRASQSGRDNSVRRRHAIGKAGWYRSPGHMPDRAIHSWPLRRTDEDSMARSTEAGRVNARLVRVPSGRRATELTRE